MRLLLLFLLGLALGIAGTTATMNAMHRKSAFPHAVMTLMGHQMGGLDQSIKQSRCTPSDLVTRLQTLRLVANEIEPAFDSMQGDAQFGRYASDLRAAADAALTTPLTSCALASTAVDRVDKACDSCHRDYRN